MRLQYVNGRSRHHPSYCDRTGAAVLNARLFGDMIRKLPDNTIYVETDQEMLTTIHCGRAMFNLVASDATEFPQLPEVENSENPIILPQSMLKSMISPDNFRRF